jgi:hypothetical protein
MCCMHVYIHTTHTQIIQLYVIVMGRMTALVWIQTCIHTSGEEDLYFSRIISYLCMTCRTNDLVGNSEVLKNLIGAMSRMLTVLFEAMPKDHTNPYKSPTAAYLHAEPVRSSSDIRVCVPVCMCLHV